MRKIYISYIKGEKGASHIYHIHKRPVEKIYINKRSLGQREKKGRGALLFLGGKGEGV